VAPDRFDQRRTGLIRACRNVTHERRGLERHASAGKRSDDEQPLTRAKIQADVDRELGVGMKLTIETGRRHVDISLSYLATPTDRASPCNRMNLARATRADKTGRYHAADARPLGIPV